MIQGAMITIGGGLIQSGGGSSTLVSKTITQNGVYDPADDNADGYSSVTVAVPTSGISTGSTPPTSGMGSDGDYYEQTIPIASGVNFVEYLESSGTQYMDTGIVVDENYSFYIKTKRLGNNHGPFGARDSAEGSNQFIVVGTSSGLRVGWGNYVTLSTGSDVCEISAKDAVFRLNGDAKAVSSVTTFTTPASIILFGNHNGTTINKGASVIYRLTIWDSGAPVADYLPCLDGNGVACLWDNVAGEYVYNDGTGDFTYGSTATPDALDPVLWHKVSGAWEVVG